MCHNSVQMAQTACHPRLYSGRIHYRAVRQLPAQRNRYRQHQDLGRYRRYLPPFCHGTGIFIPETAECRIKRRYRHTHHCGRNDVFGLHGRKRNGIHPHHQPLSWRHALHVVHSHRFQGIQRHEPSATEVHRHRAWHTGRRRSGGSCHAGCIVYTRCQSAF